MGCRPRARQHQRRPPRVAGEDRRGGDAAGHLDHAVGNKIHRDRERRPGHPQVEIAGHGEVTGQGRILQVPDAWRAHAGLGEPVVEPCGGAVAEVSAHCLVDRAEHLEQHKNRARKRQRAAQRMALLHGPDEHAHGNRERRRQHPAQQQDGPPGRSETRVRLGQDGEELPFLAGSHAFEHDRILSQSRGVYNLRIVRRRGCDFIFG